MNNIPEFQPTEACAKCKGQCCKNMGCHFAPSDFEEISFDYLKAKIEEGYISIDWWEGDHENEYYLRMRNVNAPIIDPSWGGRCMLLTDEGCSLPFEKRPLGARSLKPNSDGHCKINYSKKQCKDDWKKYRSILTRLYVHFLETEWERTKL